MNIFCRLGLHSWKLVCRPIFWLLKHGDCVWMNTERKCRRCGKRVRL